MSKKGITYSKICKVTSEFLRQYDNTTVDTYAFDKVLKSEDVHEFIYRRLQEYETYKVIEITYILKSITDYLVDQVREIYRGTEHRVMSYSTYYDYVENLISTLLKK